MADPTSAPGDHGLFSDRPLPKAPTSAASMEDGQFSERPLRSLEGTAPPKSKSPMRWVVPLVLFVVIIGGIAWLVQYMPSWRSAKKENGGAAKGPEALLAFLHPHFKGVYMALWERLPLPKDNEKPPDKPPYAREFEKGAEGRYCFPLLVHPQQDVRIGLREKSCDCSLLHVALISDAELEQIGNALRKDPGQEVAENPAWTWHLLKKGDEHGVALPAGSRAVLRMTWENRRAAGEPLNLGAAVWAREPDSTRTQEYGLKIDAVSSHPLRAKRHRIDVGVILAGGQGKAEFLVWSPTRANPNFKFRQDDPFFKIDTKPLSAADCAELQATLRQEDINTRVRAAWNVTVTVYERKDQRQFDQGHFLRALNFEMPDAPEDVPPLMVAGLVRGDIEIGAAEDQGKINLKSFAAKDGAHKTLFLWTDKKTELAKDSVQPAALKVTLTKSPAAAAAKQQWKLEVVVPPNQFFGTISEDNAVILRTGSGRLIRIPLMGSAVQG